MNTMRITNEVLGGRRRDIGGDAGEMVMDREGVLHRSTDVGSTFPIVGFIVFGVITSTVSWFRCTFGRERQFFKVTVQCLDVLCCKFFRVFNALMDCWFPSLDPVFEKSRSFGIANRWELGNGVG